MMGDYYEDLPKKKGKKGAQPTTIPTIIDKDLNLIGKDITCKDSLEPSLKTARNGRIEKN